MTKVYLNSQKKKVLCLGIANADTYAKPIDKIPKWNTLETFSDLKFYPGGCAINAAINIKSLGMCSGVAAAVGQDIHGKYIIDQLKKKKINTNNIVLKKTNTAYTFAMISSTGKRRYLTNWGANDFFTADDVNYENLKSYDLIHLCGTFAMKLFDGKETTKVLKNLKKNNLLISLDTIYNDKVNCLSLIESAFPYLDVFFPSYEELNLITGQSSIKKNIDFLKSTKIPIVGIKMGKEGSVFISYNKAYLCKPFKVPVTDTSGAGDAFMSGLIYSILHQMNAKDSLIFATACAAYNIQSMGAAGNVPRASIIKGYIKKNLNTSAKLSNFIRNIN